LLPFWSSLVWRSSARRRRPALLLDV
jgi:hypothetical protein